MLGMVANFGNRLSYPHRRVSPAAEDDRLIPMAQQQSLRNTAQDCWCTPEWTRCRTGACAHWSMCWGSPRGQPAATCVGMCRRPKLSPTASTLGEVCSEGAAYDANATNMLERVVCLSGEPHDIILMDQRPSESAYRLTQVGRPNQCICDGLKEHRVLPDQPG